MVRLMQAKAPDATIILTAIFPRNDHSNNLMPVIDRVNENLAHLAGEKIRFLNINRKLADDSGKLFEGMMNPDLLHPSLQGYQVWADALKPVLLEFSGPRRWKITRRRLPATRARYTEKRLASVPGIANDTPRGRLNKLSLPLPAAQRYPALARSPGRLP